MKSFILVCFIFFSFTITAQETINTMFYNLLEFPEASSSNRPEILKDILSEFQPDIFMVCELQSDEGANLIMDVTLNSQSNTYSRVPFVPNQSSSSDLQQLIFYKTDKFSIVDAEVIVTQVRDINKYVLKLNTVDQTTDPIYLYLFVVHLKSSQGSSNQNLRLDMVTEFTDHLETIPSDSFVIFSGDFNLYTASEPAYQELLDPSNAIVIVDPIDTAESWHNNETYQDIHTQSTRINSGPFGAGAGGGLDDRFDFITISENMMTNPKLIYVPDSYKSFGNNGNCYNMDINDDTCIGEFSQTLRDNLFNMSDHLPVIMQLETNKEFILSTPDFSINDPITLENTLVNNFLNISIPNNYSNFVEISIYNSLGQLVQQNELKNTDTNSIDVSFLQTGLYYIKTTIPNGTVLKFLKK